MTISTFEKPETRRSRLAGGHGKTLLLLFTVLATAGGGTMLLHSSPATPAAPPPLVTVATPLERQVNQWDEYVGRFAASKSVEIRPRVSGPVTEIHFSDGQMVAQGQLLFTIDPRPYAAALDEARAGVSNAASTLALARSDYARAARLRGDDAVSASEIDALHTRVEAAGAALAAAKARVEARALDVEFTQVRAPIAGRISDRRIDAGNLVAGGEGAAATLLTTINALDPIYFTFDASEALYLKARREGLGDGAPVEVRLQDETGYAWKGKLDFTDNGMDPRSGTVRGRATIANPRLLLTPGMFGNMRMESGTGRALLIPDTAVQTDQADKSVLVLGPNDIVSTRPVKLGPSIDGLRIVTAGLRPDDRVIIGGSLSAVPGTKVQAQSGTIAALADSTVSPATPVAAAATFAAN